MPGDFGNRVTRTGICDRVRSVLKFVPGFSQKTDNILKQLNKLTDENLSRNQCSRLSGLARVIEDKPDRHTLSMKLDDVSNILAICLQNLQAKDSVSTIQQRGELRMVADELDNDLGGSTGNRSARPAYEINGKNLRRARYLTFEVPLSYGLT